MFIYVTSRIIGKSKLKFPPAIMGLVEMKYFLKCIASDFSRADICSRGSRCSLLQQIHLKIPCGYMYFILNRIQTLRTFLKRKCWDNFLRFQPRRHLFTGQSVRFISSWYISFSRNHIIYILLGSWEKIILKQIPATRTFVHRAGCAVYYKTFLLSPTCYPSSLASRYTL